MNTKEKYIVAGIFTSMFLLQIWVADAEGDGAVAGNQRSIADFNEQTIRAVSKIMNDSELRPDEFPSRIKEEEPEKVQIPTSSEKKEVKKN